DVLPRIFDAFEKGSSSIAREFGGLGLGLAICKMMIELHGGTISAYSLGRDMGATFSVDLPTVLPSGERREENGELELPELERGKVAGLLGDENTEVGGLDLQRAIFKQRGEVD